jgi:hypothetical protein
MAAARFSQQGRRPDRMLAGLSVLYACAGCRMPYASLLGSVWVGLFELRSFDRGLAHVKMKE